MGKEVDEAATKARDLAAKGRYDEAAKVLGTQRDRLVAAYKSKVDAVAPEAKRAGKANVAAAKAEAAAIKDRLDVLDRVYKEIGKRRADPSLLQEGLKDAAQAGRLETELQRLDGVIADLERRAADTSDAAAAMALRLARDRRDQLVKTEARGAGVGRHRKATEALEAQVPPRAPRQPLPVDPNATPAAQAATEAEQKVLGSYDELADLDARFGRGLEFDPTAQYISPERQAEVAATRQAEPGRLAGELSEVEQRRAARIGRAEEEAARTPESFIAALTAAAEGRPIQPRSKAQRVVDRLSGKRTETRGEDDPHRGARPGGEGSGDEGVGVHRCRAWRCPP